MNGEVVKRQRGIMLKRLQNALAPIEEVTHESRQGTLEALCATTAVVFGRQHNIPIEVVLEGMIAGAALHGMEQWLEEWQTRN